MKNNSIFLRLSGKYERNLHLRSYCFFLNDSNDKINIKEITKIADPIYNSSFKYLFGFEEKKYLLKDLLISLLFGNDELIKDIILISNEFPKLKNKYYPNALRTEIECKVVTNKDIYLINIETQIVDKRNISTCCFNYGISLQNNNFYELSLLISSIKSSDFTKLTQGNKENFLNFIKLIEINIDNEISKMNNGEEIIINNRVLGTNGKEYIKLFGIRNWGEKDGERYVLPNGEIFSNKVIKECVEILSTLTENEIKSMKQYEQDFLEFVKEITENSIIKSSFQLFLSGNDGAIELIKANSIRTNEGEIKYCLNNENEELVAEYIYYLKYNDSL